MEQKTINSRLFKAIENGDMENFREYLEMGFDMESENTDGKRAINLACEKGTVEMIKTLLEKGADINEWKYFKTNLYLALDNKNYDAAKFLVENGYDMERDMGRGETPVYLAVKNDSLDMVKYLFEHGCPLSSRPIYSVMRAAIDHASEDVFDFLLENGADVNEGAGSRSGWGPALSSACRKGDINRVAKLIEKGASLNPVSYLGTPLMVALAYQRFDLAEYLLKMGADVNHPDDEGTTALMEVRNMETLEFLMERGADINKEDFQGNNALHHVDNVEILSFLIEAGAEIEHKNKEGQTPLYAKLLRKDKLDAAKLLMEKGADIKNLDGELVLNAADYNYGDTLAYLVDDLGLRSPAAERKVDYYFKSEYYSVAKLIIKSRQKFAPKDKFKYITKYVELGDLDGLKILLDKGLVKKEDVSEIAKLLENNRGRETAEYLEQYIYNEFNTRESEVVDIKTLNADLIKAVMDNDLEGVRKCIKRGAEPTASDKDGIGGAALAFNKKHFEIGKYLIEQGASANDRGSRKRTPLYHAIGSKDVELVKFLLSKKAKVNDADEDKVTPLMAACEAGSFEIVRLLLEKKAKVNEPDKYKATALLYAVNSKNLDIVKALVEKGANVEAETNHWNMRYHNALGIAAAKADYPILDYLVSKGAEINKSPRYYETPLNIAVERGDITTVEYLIKLGADVNYAPNHNFRPAIFIAAQHKNFEMFKYLAENGADLKIKEGYNSVIQSACENGNIDMVRYLIENGIDVNSSESYSGFSWAVFHGNFEIVKYMVEKGFKLEGQDSLVNDAVERNEMEIAKYLMEHGCGTSCIEEKTMENAVVYGYMDAVNFMVNELNLKPVIDNELISERFKAEFYDAVKVGIKYIDEFSPSDKPKYVRKFIELNDLEGIKILDEKGLISPRSIDKYLEYAFEIKAEDVIPYLLKIKNEKSSSREKEFKL